MLGSVQDEFQSYQKPQQHHTTTVIKTQTFSAASESVPASAGLGQKNKQMRIEEEKEDTHSLVSFPPTTPCISR
jgi:hypothetical protein